MFKHDERCTFCVRQMFCWKNSFVCIAMAFCFWALCSWHLLEHAAPSPSSFSACAKKYQRNGEKEKEREKKQPPVIVSINTNLCFYCLYLILFACVDGFLVVENHFHCSVTHQKTNLYAVILHGMKTSQADFPSRIYSTREIFRLGKCLCLRSWK